MSAPDDDFLQTQTTTEMLARFRRKPLHFMTTSSTVQQTAKTIHVPATEIALWQNSGFGPHVFLDPDTISTLLPRSPK
jgi:hypothetical protein